MRGNAGLQNRRMACDSVQLFTYTEEDSELFIVQFNILYMPCSRVHQHYLVELGTKVVRAARAGFGACVPCVCIS